ncbi:unnamed protein product [Prorocentrum cordatum]|uniref:CSD domain-containing protein n=1 Tax=Prorocentrum cordatum TaxID=2364126 RepID=A0ABN9ULG0_9DINO|nr:unnamed protein product [Polarella glacialis]
MWGEESPEASMSMAAMMAMMCKGGKKGCKGKKGGGKGKDGKDGKGKVAMRIASGEPVFSGQIKSFNVEKKHGYIVCETIGAQCGQDVYAFEDVLKRGFAGPGDTVAFFVHWSAKGQPQASSPLLRIGAAEGSWALKGTFKPPKDTSSAFGFIECAETKEFFGRDVYVNKDLAPTVTPGETVRFNAYLNRDGMPNAVTMEACDPTWEPEPSDLTNSVHLEGFSKGSPKGGGGKWGKGGGKGKKGSGWEEFEIGIQMGMQMAAKGKAKGMSAAEAQAAAEAALGVALLSGGGGKGWGGGYGKSKGKGKKGGGGGGGGGGAPPTPTGEAFTGTIKSFNEAYNYGFVDCPEVKEAYGNDVFLHGKELSGQGIGDTVYFELGVSAKGQPQAMNVQSVDANGNPVPAGEKAGQPAAKKARLNPGLQKGGAGGKGGADDEAILNAIAESMGEGVAASWDAFGAQAQAGSTAAALLGSAW